MEHPMTVMDPGEAVDDAVEARLAGWLSTAKFVRWLNSQTTTEPELRLLNRQPSVFQDTDAKS